MYNILSFFSTSTSRFAYGSIQIEISEEQNIASNNLPKRRAMEILKIDSESIRSCQLLYCYKKMYFKLKKKTFHQFLVKENRLTTTAHQTVINSNFVFYNFI